MTLTLIVLAKGPRHGYAIMTEIESMTDGDYIIAAGTLYRSLAVLVKLELIEQVPELFVPENDDARRTYYRITALGEKTLNLELIRLERLVRVGLGQEIAK